MAARYTPQGTVPAGGSRPITRDILARLTRACDVTTVAGTRDRLLLELGYALPASRGQLAALRIEDIAPDIGDALRVPLIKNGREPAHDVVCADPELVDHYQDWMLTLAVALGEPVTTGPLILGVDRHDQIRTRTPIIPETVADILHRAVARARLPQPHQYRPFSLVLGHRVDRILASIPEPEAKPARKRKR